MKDSDMAGRHYKKFRSNRKDSIWDNWKKNMDFLVTSGLLSAMFDRSHSYDSNAIAHRGHWYGAEWPLKKSFEL